MLALKVEGTNPVQVIKATDSNIACIGLFLVNYGDTPVTFDLYVVPSGKQVPQYDSNGHLVSGNEETYLIKNQVIQANDTFMLNMEKILLHPGDAVYVRKYEQNSKLAVHASYELY